MKFKKSSPWIAAGVGCLGGALVSILAIALLTIIGGSGGLIRAISYFPYVAAIIAFFWAMNRQKDDASQARENDIEKKDRNQKN